MSKYSLCALLFILVTMTTESAFSAGWVSPVSHSDASGKWRAPQLSYDKNTSTYAEDTSYRVGWGEFLELNLILSQKASFDKQTHRERLALK